MNAPRRAIADRDVRGLNLILRPDGSEIHIDDIETADQGQMLLDEIDMAILGIESQVEYDNGTNADWRRRAGTALKRKKRLRPALQQRIAQLRKAERTADVVAAMEAASRGSNGKRRFAFVQAAEAMLDRDLYVEIWQRASEADPQAFEGWEGVQL